MYLINHQSNFLPMEQSRHVCDWQLLIEAVITVLTVKAPGQWQSHCDVVTKMYPHSLFVDLDGATACETRKPKFHKSPGCGAPNRENSQIRLGRYGAA